MKLMRVPSFNVLPGTVQTYDDDVGTDPFGHEIIVPITTRCPEWQDEAHNWGLIRQSKKLPICWGPDVIKQYLNVYGLSDSFIQFTPTLFEKVGSLYRRPKCIIFGNYVLSANISTIVGKFADQFHKENITVFALPTIWPTFVATGLPVQQIDLSDPIGIGGHGVSYEMPTLLDKDHFEGGQVRIISDIDQGYKGAYGVNYFPYYPQDLAAHSSGFDVPGQIADCASSFDKIHNYVYFFCDPTNETFFTGVIDTATATPSDYFTSHIYGDSAWHTDAYNLAKVDLLQDIADFFDLTVPT